MKKTSLYQLGKYSSDWTPASTIRQASGGALTRRVDPHGRV